MMLFILDRQEHLCLKCYQIFAGDSNPGFDVLIGRDDVCFFISQSGETADTLGALRLFIRNTKFSAKFHQKCLNFVVYRYCKSRGALIVGITNTVNTLKVVKDLKDKTP